MKPKSKESERKERAAIARELLDIIQTIHDGTECELKEDKGFDEQIKEIRAFYQTQCSTTNDSAEARR